ncbi:hypothetical protein OROHE_002394 [Orobanche hederae]
MPPVCAQSGVPIEERPSPAAPLARATTSQLARASSLAYTNNERTEEAGKLISQQQEKEKNVEFDCVSEHNMGSEFTLRRVVCIFGALTADLFLASSSTPLFFFADYSSSYVKIAVITDPQVDHHSVFPCLNLHTPIYNNDTRNNVLVVSFNEVETLGSLDKLSLDNLFIRGLVGATPVSRFKVVASLWTRQIQA